MILQVDGKKLNRYQLLVWLQDYARFNKPVRPSQVTEAMAREAMADHYDYTGLYLKRPGGLRFPDNPEHVRCLARR